MTINKDGLHFNQSHTVKWLQVVGLCLASFLSGGTGVVAGGSLMSYRVQRLENLSENQQRKIEEALSQFNTINVKLERLLGKLEK